MRKKVIISKFCPYPSPTCLHMYSPVCFGDKGFLPTFMAQLTFSHEFGNCGLDLFPVKDKLTFFFHYPDLSNSIWLGKRKKGTGHATLVSCITSIIKIDKAVYIKYIEAFPN